MYQSSVYSPKHEFPHSRQYRASGSVIQRTYTTTLRTHTPVRTYTPEQLSDMKHSRWYCIQQILMEQYLWDMRCWSKPRHELTREEIKAQIVKWIEDHRSGWTHNCGHCIYCMRRLLSMKWATLEEILDLVQRNTFIQYPHKVGTWHEGFDEDEEEDDPYEDDEEDYSVEENQE